jgi:hypothetical protein
VHLRLLARPGASALCCRAEVSIDLMSLLLRFRFPRASCGRTLSIRARRSSSRRRQTWASLRSPRSGCDDLYSDTLCRASWPKCKDWYSLSIGLPSGAKRTWWGRGVTGGGRRQGFLGASAAVQQEARGRLLFVGLDREVGVPGAGRDGPDSRTGSARQATP